MIQKFYTLHFVINRFCMKLFSANSVDIINDCQTYFSLKLPSEFEIDYNELLSLFTCTLIKIFFKF